MATDQSYFEEALNSVRSLRKHTDVKAAILTTERIQTSNETTLFDDVRLIEEPHQDMRDKSFNLHRTPYEKTLYLDSDTFVISDVSSVFTLLDRVDFAAAHSTTKQLVSLETVPDSFPALNAGVIAYRNSPEIQRLFDRWTEILEEQVANGRPDATFPVEDGETLEEVRVQGRTTDQPPLREALYESDVTFAILPDEYNFGAWGRSYAYGEVKILHVSSHQRRLLRGTINERIDRRIYLGDRIGKLYFTNGDILPVKPLLLRVPNLVVRKSPIKPYLQRTGIWPYVKRAYSKYRNKVTAE